MKELLATFNAIEAGMVAGTVPMFGTDSDPFGVVKTFSKVFHKQDALKEGVVVGYNPNTHSASVLVADTQSIWPCVMGDEPLSYAFGYSATYPPREGEIVLVYQQDPEVRAGIIIGRMAYPLCYAATGDLHNDPDHYHRRLFTQLEDTWDIRIPSMMMPLHEKNDNSSHIASHFRPTDIFPGEFANVNQHNCGIKGGAFSATLLGGGASLRLSALTNAARLTCDSYIRHTMHGSMQEFHNGRYLSSERNYALYQEERLGGSGLKADVWTEDAKAPIGGENQTIRPRIKDLTGYFGNLSAKFCLRPDPDQESPVRIQGEGPAVEAGVSRETIDPSGQYRLSAAGMIAIERTGRIPVPVRNCYPTDEGHDYPGEDNDKARLKPFEHKTEDPGYRQLELYDRQAYDLKNQYSRVDGLGQDVSDYDVPQEEDMRPLDDSYDSDFFGNETVKLKEYDGRRAGMYIGEDGSVIIRDAWGSEIVMLGGNVTISCAGNVMMLPGKTQLTIAGDDIVHKAQNSVDIHASEHDIRLSAARNMEIVGGGDEEEYSGGVVIESRGKGFGGWDGTGEGKGEDARISGITLRSKSQGVTIDGARVNMRSRTDTRIISGNEDLGGNVSVVAKNIRTIAKTTIIAGAPKESDASADYIRSTVRSDLNRKEYGDFGDVFNEEDLSAITISQKSVMAVAQSIGLFADKSLAAAKGKKLPVPMTWADAESNIAETVRPYIADGMDDLLDEKKASAGFDVGTLEKMVFNFRTSPQCGTNASWNIGGDSSGAFKMYEPAWIQVINKFDTLRGVSAKKYDEKAKWDNGEPWPGQDAMESAQYARLPESGPVNLTEHGFNVRRDGVQPQSSIEEIPLADGYLVRK